MAFLPPGTQPYPKIWHEHPDTPRFQGRNHSSARGGNNSFYTIGHSLMSQENPRMLDAMATSDGNEPTRWNYQWITGSPLFNHAENFRSIDPPGSTYTRNNDLADRWDAQLALGYDALIMTEGVDETQGVAPHLQYNRTIEISGILHAAARAGNPGCDVWMMETAMYQTHPTLAEWYASVRGEHLIAWNSFRIATVAVGRDIKMIYAGQAFADLYDAVQAGNITGISDFTFFFADFVHPNSVGFYFNACVIYSYIYGKSPVGLAYSGISNGAFGIYDAPSATLAGELQALAWASYNEHRNMI